MSRRSFRSAAVGSPAVPSPAVRWAAASALAVGAALVSPGVTATAHEQERAPVPADDPVLVLEVRSGVALTDRGQPVAGAFVAFVPPGEGPTEAELHAAATDDAGRLAVPVPEDGVVVLIWKDGFAPVAVWAGYGGEDLIALEPGQTLDTRIATPSGDPLPGARVGVDVEIEVLGSPPPERSAQRFVLDGLTDAQGGRLFEDLPAVAVGLHAEADGWVPGEIYPAVPGGAPVELVLRRGARISGTVRVDPGNAAAVGAVVTVGERRAEVGADGSFDIAALPGGAHDVLASGPGLVESGPRRVVLADGEHREKLDLVVLAASRLPIRLVDEDERAIPAAVVALLWPARTGFDERPQEERERVYDVTTDASGGFRIEGLRPADGVVVEVRAPGFVPEVLTGVSLPPGAAARRLDVKMKRGARLAGGVLGPDGVPLDGALVEARAEGDGAGRPAAAASLTGPDGRFLLDGLPPGRVRLRVVAPEGVAASEGAFGPYLGGGEVPEDVGDLRLAAGHRLRGRVLGAPDGAVLWIDGAAAELARVELSGEDFEVAGLPPGPVWLTVTSDDTPGGAQGRTDIPAGWPVELRWRAARRVAVRVTDERGVAVPEALLLAEPLADDEGVDTVGATPRSREQRVRDPEGRVDLDLGPGRWRLTARAGPAHGRVEIALGDAASDRAVDDVVELRLRGGETIRGEVASSITGAPLEGATVEVVALDGGAGTPPPAATDRSGRFRIPGVAPGVVRLRVSARGHAPLDTQPYVVELASGLDVGRIEIASGIRLHGRVWSAVGAPARGVDLAFEHDDGLRRRQRTDIYGRFEFRGLPPGGGVLVRGSSAQRVELPAGADEVEVELDVAEGTRLTGRVTDAGRSVPYAQLLAWSTEPPRIRVDGRTDAHGRFELPPLPAGLVWLEVTRPGASDPWETTHQLGQGETEYVDLEVPESWITGVVLEGVGGSPVAGAFVVAWEVDGDGAPLRSSGRSVTHADGRFRIEGLPQGAYEIEARRSGYGAGRAVGLLIGPRRGADDVTVRLPAPASVGVEIVDERGRAVPGAWISAALEGRDQQLTERRAYTDLSGRATLGGLASGSWEVVIGASGRGRMELGLVGVDEGVVDLGRVQLPAAGTLRVTAFRPGYLPAADVEVTVRDVLDRDPRAPRPDARSLGGRGRSYFTDAHGTLLLTELAPGFYDLYPADTPSSLGTVRIEPGRLTEAVLLAPWASMPAAPAEPE